MKFKTLAVAIIAAAGLCAALWFQHQSLLQLQAENEALRAQADEAAQLSAENERLSNLVAHATSSPAPNQQRELLRLRGEVGMLRNQTNELNRLLQEGNQRLQAAMQARAATPVPPQAQSEADSTAVQLKQQGISKMNDARSLLVGLITLAQANQGRLPTSLDQVQPYLAAHPENTFSGTNQFDLVYQGSWSDIGNPSSAIVVRETQPWQNPNGTWLRAYGFADGHSEIHQAPDGNFGPWEQQHMAVPRQAAQ